MIELCLNHDLPEPKLEEIAGSFVVTFRKSKLTEESLEGMELNERQRKIVEYLKKKKKVTNKEYVSINKISRNTATNDLRDLMIKKIIRQIGAGRGSYYELV